MFDASKNDVLSLSAPASRTATVNGSSVNVLDYIGIAEAVLDSAAGTGTAPTLDVKIQDSSDGVTFADIAGKAFTQVTGSISLQSLSLNMGEIRGFVRAVITITGTGPAFICSVTLRARNQKI